MCLRKRSTPAPPETGPAPRPHALRLRHTTPRSSALRRDASLSRCPPSAEGPPSLLPPPLPCQGRCLGRNSVAVW
jgi:hypothetical protein